MTTLTMKEEKRLKIIQRVFQGGVTVVQAALVLEISERQCYRIKARVKKGGAKAWSTVIEDDQANERSRRRQSSGSWS